MNKKKNNNYVKHGKKIFSNYNFKITLLSGLIIMVLTILLTPLGDMIYEHFKPIKMTHISLFPYKEEQYFAQNDDVDFAIDEVQNAFYIQATFKNLRSSGERFTDVLTYIDHIEQCSDYEIISLTAYVDGNTLNVVAFNNNLSGLMFNASTFGTLEYDELENEFIKPLDDNIFIQTYNVDQAFLEPGEVIGIASFTIDPVAFRSRYNNSDMIFVSGMEDSDGHYGLGFLTINSDDSFSLTHSQGGDSSLNISFLSAVVDVDNPKTIKYTEPYAFPEISSNGTYVIRTLIAPTKSCSITLHNHYEVGNKSFDTPQYTVNVSVNYYTLYEGAHINFRGIAIDDKNALTAAFSPYINNAHSHNIINQ